MDRTTDRTPFRANWDLCALSPGENKNDKNSLVRVGTQGLFRPYLKTFVPPFLPTRLTAPGSPRTENSSSPPALSCNEKMRTGQKSDLIWSYITRIEVNTTFERPSVDMLPRGKYKTFKHYAFFSRTSSTIALRM